MTHFVDVAIIGAGISGLSVADACIQKGTTCAVIDKMGPGEGTSGAPGMLVNAATGRRAKKSWEAENGYKHILSLLSRVKAYSGEDFFVENSVLRPALTKKLADNFQRSITKYEWPHGWIEWIDKERVNSDYPYIDNEFGALLVKKGLTVNGQLFLKACSRYLSSVGLLKFYNKNAEYLYEKGRWHLKLENGDKISAKSLVDARGAAQASVNEWSFIPFHNIKGQTATFSYSDPLPLTSSISSLGYMAFLTFTPRKLTVGSTYEHDFENYETDESGLKYLLGKLERTLPEYSNNFQSVSQWAGVRTTVKDKKPVIGPHPTKKGLYVIGALGSKGLLLGRYLAEILADHIISGKSIDPHVSTERFSQIDKSS